MQALKKMYNFYDTAKSESDQLFKQILIFENHAHDNFEEIDGHMENLEGMWDGNK